MLTLRCKEGSYQYRRALHRGKFDLNTDTGVWSQEAALGVIIGHGLFNTVREYDPWEVSLVDGGVPVVAMVWRCGLTLSNPR